MKLQITKSYCLLVMLLIVVSSKAQLINYTFNGAASCTNGSQGNVNTTALSNATVSNFSRTADLSCYATQDNFGSTGFVSATTVNYNQYVEVSLTANPGYQLNLTSVNFNISRLSAGPQNGKVAHNGTGGDFTSANFDFTIPTTSTPINWDFADFSTGSGGTIKFRIYGWNATGSGVMKLWGFSLYGTVTVYNPNTIATPNLLGMVKVGNGLNIDATGLLKTNIATQTVLGAVKVGSGLKNDTTGVLSVVKATNSGLGVVKVGSNITIDSNATINIPQPIDTGASPQFAGQTIKGAINAQSGYFNNMGIGTVNINDTAYKLFVEKGIRTRKVQVDIDNWADYVFDANYQLPTLQYVEAYIAKNKHLPEMPSTATVNKEGIDLGANQALLLKKIEELTLYIIQLEKKVKYLETNIK